MVGTISRLIFVGLIIVVSISGHASDKPQGERSGGIGEPSVKIGTFLIGATIMPYHNMEQGTATINGERYTIEWLGRGAAINLSWITPLYYRGASTDLFLSLHADGGMINFSRKAFTDRSTQVNYHDADQGRYWFVRQRFRINVLFVERKIFGPYFETGISRDWWTTTNQEPGELVTKGSGYSGMIGCGGLVFLPVDPTLAFDFGISIYRHEQEAMTLSWGFNIGMYCGFM